jgi:hypothetical protein
VFPLGTQSMGDGVGEDACLLVRLSLYLSTYERTLQQEEKGAIFLDLYSLQD